MINFASLPNKDVIASIVGPQAAAAITAHSETLTSLVQVDPVELTKLTGVGPARAAQIKAALELAGKLSREGTIKSRCTP